MTGYCLRVNELLLFLLLVFSCIYGLILFHNFEIYHIILIKPTNEIQNTDIQLVYTKQNMTIPNNILGIIYLINRG